MSKPSSLLVATIKNEGPNILEWIAHHRLCGFDRIQIFLKGNDDNTVRSLRTLQRLGVIDFTEIEPDGDPMQAHRLTAESDAYGACDYCMVLDGNDFLNIHPSIGKVADLIAASPEEADAILINRKTFGANGQDMPARPLITERFTRAEASDAIRGHQWTPFKPLFRTDSFLRPGSHLPHDPRVETPVYANGSGLREGQFELKNWRSRDPNGRSFAQVNHYALQDLGSFLLKQVRALGEDLDRAEVQKLWAQHNRNDEDDLTLANRAEDLREEMRALDEASEGRLLRLRRRAFRRSREEIEDLLTRPDLLSLRNALLATGAEGASGDGAEEDGKETPELALTSPFRLPRPPVKFASKRDSEDAPGDLTPA